MQCCQNSSDMSDNRTFLARLHFNAEELLLYSRHPCLRWQLLKSWNFSLSVFFLAFLTLLIILIKPLTTKAHDRRASSDCGTSGL